MEIGVHGEITSQHPQQQQSRLAERVLEKDVTMEMGWNGIPQHRQAKPDENFCRHKLPELRRPKNVWVSLESGRGICGGT